MTMTLIFDKGALKDFQIDGVSQGNVSEVWIHACPNVSEYLTKYACMDRHIETDRSARKE